MNDDVISRAGRCHRHVVLFLDYLDHVVQREVAGERDSTTRYKLIESLNFASLIERRRPKVRCPNFDSEIEATRVVDYCASESTLENPRSCDFKLASVGACPKDAPAADCLTNSQRTAIESIYSPARLGGAVPSAGQPFGNEADPAAWQVWITGMTPIAVSATKNAAPSLQGGFGTEFFKVPRVR